VQAHGRAANDSIHADGLGRLEARTDRRSVSGNEAVFPGRARRRRPFGGNDGGHEGAVSKKGARVMRLGSKGTGKDQRPMLLLLNQPEAGKTLNPVERTSLAVTIRHTLCDQSQELKWIQSRGKD